MQIERVEYPVTGKRKYKVIHNGKEYSCYIQPCCCPSYIVCTGDGRTEESKDISGTQLASEIYLQCGKI